MLGFKGFEPRPPGPLCLICCTSFKQSGPRIMHHPGETVHAMVSKWLEVQDDDARPHTLTRLSGIFNWLVYKVLSKMKKIKHNKITCSNNYY